jgi:hypothetical protein
VLIAGAIAAVLLTRDDGSSSRRNEAPVSQQPRQQPPKQPSDAALSSDVKEMGAILDLSAEGRALTTGGDFDGAIANRLQVIAKLDALEVDPQLAEARSTLRDAMDASIESNQAHRSCGDCATARAADTRATQLKTQFARMFNPFAERYLQRSYDPSKI